jgi:hypothetical protein
LSWCWRRYVEVSFARRFRWGAMHLNVGERTVHQGRRRRDAPVSPR